MAEEVRLRMAMMIMPPASHTAKISVRETASGVVITTPDPGLAPARAELSLAEARAFRDGMTRVLRRIAQRAERAE